MNLFFFIGSKAPTKMSKSVSPFVIHRDFLFCCVFFLLLLFNRMSYNFTTKILK